MSLNHGKVWWSELMTRELEAARDYYGRVYGWEFDEMPMEEGAYLVASAHGAPVAGLMQMPEGRDFADLPPHWFTYLAVADVEKAVAETRAAGGKVKRAPFDVPGVGLIAILEDPTGAAVGIMTPVQDVSGGSQGGEIVGSDDDPELENVPL